MSIVKSKQSTLISIQKEMIKRFVEKQGNRSNNGYLVAKYNGKKQHSSFFKKNI